MTTKVVSVWRPDPGSELGVAPDESRPRLSGEDAVRVADYLDGGAVLARTTAQMVDPWSADGAARVGLSQRTDGVWRWDDAVAYYVRHYHLNPGPEFVAYVRQRGFTPPVLGAGEVSAVTDEVFGTPGAPVADRPLRLDGTQLLACDSYCVYQGRAFRYNSAGRGAEMRIHLALSPGQVIPDGFEPKDHRSSFVQAIAYKTVPAAEVEALYRVITVCQYKGAPFSIERIDGPRLRVAIGGGRRIKPSLEPVAPTRNEWGQFANAEVLGIGEIWADIDIVEAAQLTMAIVPYHRVGERLVPIRDVTGAGYSVPAADEIFYFPSPAESPYLPPAQAMATVRNYLATHDPTYPAADLAAQRLRDGWLLTSPAAVDTRYCVADDNQLATAPADAPASEVSSQLSAAFRSRHPFVDPPPHHDTGTDIFD